MRRRAGRQRRHRASGAPRSPQRTGPPQRATEDWALERDNDPMPGRAWKRVLGWGTLGLVLHDAWGPAVGGRPAIAASRVKPASGRAGWPRRRPPEPGGDAGWRAP